MVNSPDAMWRNCYKCGYEGNTLSSQCPNCGQRLRSANEIRWLGVVLVLCGVFLAAVGGGLFIFLGYIFTQAGQPGSGIKMSEQAGDGSIFIIVFGIFALLIALGLTAITAGAWQIFFGRRNKFLVYMFLGLVVVTFAVGSIARFLIE
jgi:hypothetical protein